VVQKKLDRGKKSLVSPIFDLLEVIFRIFTEMDFFFSLPVTFYELEKNEVFRRKNL
jgi:hypothetical protein